MGSLTRGERLPMYKCALHQENVSVLQLHCSGALSDIMLDHAADSPSTRPRMRTHARQGRHALRRLLLETRHACLKLVATCCWQDRLLSMVDASLTGNAYSLHRRCLSPSRHEPPRYDTFDTTQAVSGESLCDAPRYESCTRSWNGEQTDRTQS